MIARLRQARRELLAIAAQLRGSMARLDANLAEIRKLRTAAAAFDEDACRAAAKAAELSPAELGAIARRLHLG